MAVAGYFESGPVGEMLPSGKEGMAIQRHRHTLTGQVQGVGFRPHVFRVAAQLELSGEVRNTGDGVVVEVQGTAPALESFAHLLVSELPPLARISSHSTAEIPTLQDERGFSIARSAAAYGHSVLISPDMAVCADCLDDIADPQNRRHHYPFTNCTNCGPRYTITRSVPYDRAFTSMACFPQCPECGQEYMNPLDRRFHAQPNACPVCGPGLWFIPLAQAGSPAVPGSHFSADGVETGRQASNAVRGYAGITALAALLARGGLAAVKGLGGFHLACSATDDTAVQRLRQYKNRPHKPLAVMVASPEEAGRIARVNAADLALLASRERPIVLCPLSGEGRKRLSPALSPDTSRIGIMLPYTPFHYLLLQRFADVCRSLAGDSGLFPAVLVMTSGNRGGEPICLGNREAAARLAGIAGNNGHAGVARNAPAGLNGLLFHDRDILIRVDDSVVQSLPPAIAAALDGPENLLRAGAGRTLFFRRARGYVPSPLPLPDLAHPAPCVMAYGAELKNTLCITKGNEGFVSQHIGDMENVETANFHREIGAHLATLLAVQPELAVRDAHPDFLSSRLAEESGLPVRVLQHHAAHAYAVLAENRFPSRALALTLDGTGLAHPRGEGEPALWGGEVFLVDMRTLTHERVGSLSPLPLPGGDAAVREPWRIAHAALLLTREAPQNGNPSMLEELPLHLPWLPEYAHTAAHIPMMVRKNLNTPWSTSCGRLFDAVSALLGLCSATSYEGQAAIRLEECARKAEAALPNLILPEDALAGRNSLLELNSLSLFACIATLRKRGFDSPPAALAFHSLLAEGLTRMALALSQKHGVRAVGLSGGCCNNTLLLEMLVCRLRAAGLAPLFHHALPPGDGCISYGQAVWGRAQR